MKKILTGTLILSLFLTTLFSYENNHMGDHMHNGKMMNHSNPNGITDKQMKRMINKKNKHMGDHMHNGKMMNHSNPNGITNKQIKEKGLIKENAL